jgi:hypothetical protein
MEAKLEGKGVRYMIEQILEIYTRVIILDIKKAEQDKELEAISERLSLLNISGESGILTLATE